MKVKVSIDFEYEVDLEKEGLSKEDLILELKEELEEDFKDGVNLAVIVKEKV